MRQRILGLFGDFGASEFLFMSLGLKRTHIDEAGSGTRFINSAC